MFAGQHTWILSESNPGVEVPLTYTSGQADWTFLPSAVPGKEHRDLDFLPTHEFS